MYHGSVELIAKKVTEAKPPLKSVGSLDTIEDCAPFADEYKSEQKLNVSHDDLYTDDCTAEYTIHLGSTELQFQEKTHGVTEITPLSKRYKYFWNLTDDERDFTFHLWELLDGKGLIPDDENVTYGGYECYKQRRNSMCAPDVRLVKCLNMLERYGYLKTYSIRPEQDHPLWHIDGKSDGTLDLAVLDMQVFKSQLFNEKLQLILSEPDDSKNLSFNFLTNRNGHQYKSIVPGALGGHDKLKIYGRLDCPSAARFIAKGQYIQHRLFFADEETAIAAGFRPCGVCMKEAYKKWKEANKKE